MNKEKLSQSVWEEPEVKAFIDSRNINFEDFYILEELVKIPKRLLIMDFHNFFSFAKENSEKELERALAFLETVKEDPLLEQRKKLNRLLLDFVRKYNWAVAWNLVSVFERRKL
ncbi:MAG: hypothetical protein HYT64_01925 [Candidatus Yanofskybacteria bacterium]|nr:hypothetical protein [Candidatus Yanofskybacteria bacterium]